MRIVFIILVFIFIAGPEAGAFVYADEKTQFDGDIREATSRAHDFKRYLTRERESAEEAARDAQKILRAREEEVAREDKIRQDFVRQRDRNPLPEDLEAKYEKEYDRQKLEEDRVNEQARLKYIQGRERVRHALQNEAYIDEGLEYEVSTRDSKPNVK